MTRTIHTRSYTKLKREIDESMAFDVSEENLQERWENQQSIRNQLLATRYPIYHGHRRLIIDYLVVKIMELKNETRALSLELEKAFKF